MKPATKIWLIVLPLFLIMALVAWGSSWLGGQASAQTVQPTTNQTRSISVSGQGRVSIRPDTAIVWLGVQTQAETAEEALAENNVLMQDVISVTLTVTGVTEADIQTHGLRLNPIYAAPTANNTNQQLTVTGYRASNVVEVRVNNLENLGGLLDSAVAAGGNTIEGIRFEVSDSDEALAQAREQAMANARDKAEQLAALANAELGEVLTITETSFLPPTPIAFEAADRAAAEVPVQPGTQVVDATVQVTWELR